MSMKINDRISTAITNARTTRMMKNRAWTSKYNMNSKTGSMATGGKNGAISKQDNLLLQFLQQMNQNKDGMTGEQLAEKQSKIYDYDIIAVSADRVKGHMDKLSADGDASLYTDEPETRVVLEREIKGFVDDYNIAMRKLNGIGDSVSEACKRKLKSEISGRQSALKQLGITVNSDGTLACDTKTLKNADTEDIKNVFCGEKGLSDRVKELMENISKNADTQQEALKKEIYNISANYNRYGADNGSYGTAGNRYNAKG